MKGLPKVKMPFKNLLSKKIQNTFTVSWTWWLQEWETVEQNCRSIYQCNMFKAISRTLRTMHSSTDIVSIHESLPNICRPKSVIKDWFNDFQPLTW